MSTEQEKPTCGELPQTNAGPVADYGCNLPSGHLMRHRNRLGHEWVGGLAAPLAGAQGETRADVGMLTLPTFTTIQELAALIGNVLSVMGYNLSMSENHRLAKVIAESYCPGGWLLRVAALEAEREAFYMDYRIKCDRKTKAQAEEIARLRADLDIAASMVNEREMALFDARESVKALQDKWRQGMIGYAAVYRDDELADAMKRAEAAESQVQALQAHLECMVAHEERDQWQREAQRLAVERAYVQGVFLDAGVEVGPDLGEAARAVADLLSEAQQTRSVMVTQPNGEPVPAPCCIEGCHHDRYAEAQQRIETLTKLAREVLVRLPDNLPSSELYVAVDNLAAVIPAAPREEDRP